MLSAAAATSILSLSGTSALAVSEANGQAQDSPGFLSGNSVQAPLEVPVNACGNTVDAAAGLNPAFGNKCGNVSDGPAHHPHHGQPSHHGQSPHHGESPRQGGGHEAEPESKPGAKPARHHAGPGQHAGPEHHAPASHGPAKEPRSRDEQASGTSGSAAQGASVGSPGVGAGNNAKAPVDVPVNACGNHVGLVSLLSPVFGNGCDVPAPEPPEHHPEHHAPAP
ncbi:chaplin, partial [Streptomyces flavofungini]|uniref:chaplin n=1 Tax=Streptomyces flavofungini TaxID=68200 RepID=UPI0034DDF10B